MPNLKEEDKKEKTKSAGGTEIEVDTTTVDVPEAAEPEGEPEKQPEVEGGVAPEVSLVNEALIETVVRVLGKTLALVTKIPEMDFDEIELEQLKNLWSPLVPSFSPRSMAIVGTLVIVGGKVGIYIAKRPKKVIPVRKEAGSPEATSAAESIEKQLEKEWQG